VKILKDKFAKKCPWREEFICLATKDLCNLNDCAVYYFCSGREIPEDL